MQQWFIEGYWDGRNSLNRLPLNKFPFQIGRGAGLGLTIDSRNVSRVHAEFDTNELGNLIIRDLGSTNGTFVNRNQIQGEQLLDHGDIVHLANIELRVMGETGQEEEDSAFMTQIGLSPLSNKLPTGVREFQELLDRRLVIPHFQPLIHASDDSLHAYEVLGRGSHPALPEGPGGLFHIAESIGMAVHLSELFRDSGLDSLRDQAPEARVFLNTHPEEVVDPGHLIESLEQMRKRHPDTTIVLEIHEEAVTKPAVMKELIAALNALKIELAYDDFGAGQARLMELIDMPPRYIKFDIALLRDIDKAPDNQVRMVESLLRMTQNLGLMTVAEGLSRLEEVNIAKSMGFDLIQGFYYGLPSPTARWPRSE